VTPPTLPMLRILLIEDNAGDARLLREMFSTELPGSFEVTHVVRMSEGVAHLAKGNTDIVLVDMGLPDEHGLATVRRTKAAAPGVPVIVLTGLDDEMLAAEAMRVGAEDYLIKGQIESRALPRALRHAIERRRLQADADLIRSHQMQLKEEFLSHVSHELRSPLTAIYQFVTILLDGLAGALTPPQHQNLEIVLKNVEQLRVLIDDLLEITRIQAGKLTVDLQSTSITEAIAYAVSTLGGAAKKRDITLTSNLECRLPLVYADPTRLRQILVILIDNAIKFTPVGGSVRVHATAPGEQSNVVTLEVSDSGPGIDPDMTELIFARQFQADAALEGRRGLGLGLFICKELVARQGGRVWAKNLPERGAVFTVTLPVLSLPNLIAPLILKEASSAHALALIRVDSTVNNGWPSDVVRAEWSRESRALIQGCLFRPSDALVPKSDSGGATEICFVVAFGNDEGIAMLTKRIREQFGQLGLVRQLGLTVSVSFKSLRQIQEDNEAPPHEYAVTTAANIAALINSEIYYEVSPS
jgi:signal transduction histidine kinase